MIDEGKSLLLATDGRTDERTDGQTEGRADKVRYRGPCNAPKNTELSNLHLNYVLEVLLVVGSESINMPLVDNYQRKIHRKK